MPDTKDQEALTQARIDIAALKAQSDAQGREIGELKAAIFSMSQKLDSVANTLTEAKGGWKLMMALGGAGATFGALFVWFVQHIAGKGAP